MDNNDPLAKWTVVDSRGHYAVNRKPMTWATAERWRDLLNARFTVGGFSVKLI